MNKAATHSGRRTNGGPPENPYQLTLTLRPRRKLIKAVVADLRKTMARLPMATATPSTGISSEVRALLRPFEALCRNWDMNSTITRWHSINMAETFEASGSPFSRRRHGST